jgi:uncharacterized protein (TIGR03083 family)
MTFIDPGALYTDAQGRIAALARSLPADAFDRPIAACPGWRVHDLLAHLAGVAADFASGNMEGAPGDAWTAAQVDARRAWSLTQVLDDWAEATVTLAAALHAAGERAPAPPLFDLATHEQDLRGAVGAPRWHDDAMVAWGVPRIVRMLGRTLPEQGCPPVVLRVDGVEHAIGERDGATGAGAPALGLDLSAFELFRSVFGRRSEAQLRALPWSGGDPAAVVRALPIFPLPLVDIVE